MRTTTVVIGAGHGGLAMSRCLSDRSIDHVVLERSEVANSWRTERWDSLRLLTPNWQCRLPGYAYDGDDPDGFMTMPEVVEFITGYAKDIAAPVQTGTTVTSVRRTDDGYCVTTDHDEWECLTVVLATGAFNVPRVPAFAEAVPASVTTLTPMEYRNPDRARRGWGAGRRRVGDRGADRPRDPALGPSGHAGRRRARARARACTGVATSTGGWRRPACSTSATTRSTTSCARAACRRCSSEDRPSAPRSTSTRSPSIGVKLVGRLAGIRDGHAQFSGSLRNKCELADLKLDRLLDTIDEWATANGMDDATPPPHRFAPTVVPEPPTLDLDLTSGAIQTIIWATGFRPDYSWLDVDVLDGKGLVRHDGGVVDSPGMYLIGVAVPASAQVELHRRRLRRRAGPHRRAGALLGRHP